MFPRRLFVASSLLALLALGTACTDKDVAKRAYLEKGKALVAEGNVREGILELRNALKLDRRFGEARFQLAEAYLIADEPQQARREFIRAAELLPQNLDAQTRAAGILLGAGDYQAARKHAEAALALDRRHVEAQILLATALAGLKDPEAAVRELEAAMQNAPGDARPYVSLGGLNATLGHAKEAEAAFEKAVEIDPKSVSARLALGYFYWNAGRLADAEAALNAALAIDQKHERANRTLAAFLMQQDRADDAETPLLRLVNQKDADGTLTLADLYVRTSRIAEARPLFEGLLGDKQARPRAVARLAALDYGAGAPEKALDALERELRSKAGSLEPGVLYSELLTRERRLDEALQAAQKTVGANPQAAHAHFALGKVQRERGELDAAVASFGEAARLDATLAGPDLQLARLHLARRDAEKALHHARTAAALEPRNPEARLQLAAALVATGRLQQAEIELKTLASEHPAVAGVRTLYGQTLLGRGDLAGAARELDRALALAPRDVEALTGRLSVDLKRQAPQEGRARLQRAIAEDGGSADLLMLAARFEQTLGDHRAAEKFLRLTLQKDPARLDAYQALGESLIKQERLEAARAELEQVVKRQPDSVPARTMIAMILDAQRQQDAAVKVYESIVTGGGRAPVAANNLAWIYAMRGERLDTALQLAQDAKQQMPDSPEVNDTLGWVYYKKDMADLAARTLEASVQKDPKNPLYRYHLGFAYAKAGQPAKARQMLEEALRLAPDAESAPEARKTVASLKG